MVTTGLSELKSNLRKFVSLAKKGEDVVITERGAPVARLVRESGQRRTLQERLAPLIEKGIVSELPRGRRSERLPDLIKIKGKPLSETIIEDRG